MLFFQIKWNVLIDYIFDYIGLSTDKEELNIVVHCEKYLRHLVQLLSRTPPRYEINNSTSSRFLIYIHLQAGLWIT